MTDLTTRLLVIGGGPGGYVCASRAARLGVDTILVEGQRLGGTCLNVGCIPSKALIHAAQSFRQATLQAATGQHGIRVSAPELHFGQTQDWMAGIVTRLVSGVGGLMDRSSVRVIAGWARFVDGKTAEVECDTGPVTIRAEYVVIATGSRPVELSALPFGGDVISSTEALALEAMPDRLAVVGAGYIGLELGTAFAKLGSKVTVVEAANRILPGYDDALTRPVRRRLSDLGVDLRLSTTVGGRSDAGLEVSSDDGPDTISADRILVTVGRTPNTRGLNVETLNLRMDGRFIAVDARCEASMRGVHAIGDVTAGPMLAHRAMAQAELVADVIAGRRARWDRVVIPAVCFTDPEIVSVGMAPEEAGEDAAVSVFQLRANGRALTLDNTEGFVRIVARRSDHVILGVQGVGHGLSEMSGEFALMIEAALRAEDVAGTIHAHPTLSEAAQESALGLSGMMNHG